MANSLTGVAFTPFETRVDTILRIAQQAEALDLERVEVAEAWSHDATIVLAQIAAGTLPAAKVGTTWVVARGARRFESGRFESGW